MSPVIELHDVSFRYDGPMILENVNLTVEQGEFLGVVGPNGGGKTTLLKLLLGLLDPIQGTVRVMGHVPAEARHAIGYVPQFATFRRDFPISVEETVLLGRLGLCADIWRLFQGGSGSGAAGNGRDRGVGIPQAVAVDLVRRRVATRPDRAGARD